MLFCDALHIDALADIPKVRELFGDTAHNRELFGGDGDVAEQVVGYLSQLLSSVPADLIHDLCGCLPLRVADISDAASQFQMRHKRVFEFALACWFIRACRDYTRRSVPPAAAKKFLAETASRDLCVQRIAAEAAGADAATDTVAALLPPAQLPEHGDAARWDDSKAECAWKDIAFSSAWASSPSVLGRF